MSELALSIGSLLIGVLATVLVSRYYFRRTVDKGLTPYLQFISSLFEGVDPSVRESLKIAYKGTAVTELLEVQFLIANTGERSIRDVIAPLSLDIPNGCALLDASILHISPEGREVKITQTATAVSFVFPLLNANDFFIAKLLLQGRAKTKDFKFRITADDLPPTIPLVPLPYDLVETGQKRRFEAELLWIGLVLFLIGASLAGLLFTQWPTLQSCWSQGIITSFPHNWITLLSSIVAVIPAIFMLVVGPMMMVGAFTNFSFQKRRKFRIPEDFARRRFYFDGLSIDEIEKDEDKKTKPLK
jgi:hypothetical protein